MGNSDAPQTDMFWSPEFTYDHRADGSILMRQLGELPDYLPTLAGYLDKWADETPDQAWLARRVTRFSASSCFLWSMPCLPTRSSATLRV